MVIAPITLAIDFPVSAFEHHAWASREKEDCKIGVPERIGVVTRWYRYHKGIRGNIEIKTSDHQKSR
jgi:hypothetical protein